MSTPAKRRLIKDLNRLSKSTETVYAQPLDDDLYTWCAVIIGPENTPFQNGTFTLLLFFSESYPHEPPHVQFISKMFHPNIYKNGDLCLDILKNKWSPTYDVLSVLLSIQSLLNDANCDSPADIEAAELIKNETEYKKRIKKCVYDSWTDVQKIIQSCKKD